MTVKVIANDSMVERKTGTFVNPMTFADGIVFVRSYAPSSYVKRIREEGNAWLPRIYIYQPNETATVMVTGGAIYSKKAVKTNRLRFTPTYGWLTDAETKDIAHVFKDAFLTEEDTGDLAVLRHVHKPTQADIDEDAKHNLADLVKTVTSTEWIGENYGEQGYSSIDNRDMTVHASMEDLDSLLEMALVFTSSHSYDLVFTEHAANSKKLYTIQIKPEELREFIPKIIAQIKSD
jgi:hypothetical protein